MFKVKRGILEKLSALLIRYYFEVIAANLVQLVSHAMQAAASAVSPIFLKIFTQQLHADAASFPWTSPAAGSEKLWLLSHLKFVLNFCQVLLREKLQAK